MPGKLTGASAVGDSYELTASFRSVDGITVGTDVRLAGVKVGRVTSMALNPETYRAEHHDQRGRGHQRA